MDLIATVQRWVFARPRVLLVDAPGTSTLRWQVEAELDRRDWPVALSPADADLLLVLGTPGPLLSSAVDALAAQLPQPCHRATVLDDADLDVHLDTAVGALLDVAWRRTDTDSPADPPAAAEHHGRADRHADRAGPDSADGGHDNHHMHHGGDVAELAMAGTAPDRDGLELDSLQVSMGPVLPAWPTGLLLRGALQGDVLTDVELSWLDHERHDGTVRPNGDTPARALDRLARFLFVAGWPSAAREARQARDGLRSTDPATASLAQRRGARVGGRVRASRPLTWSVRGIGVLTHASSGSWAAGPAEVCDDVLDRVRRWCDVLTGPDSPATGEPEVPISAVASLLEGAELAAARLIVASLDLDPAARRDHEIFHV